MGYKVSHIDTNGTVIRPEWYSTKKDFWFSENNFKEYQDLVDTVGSVQFVDTGSRFRFRFWVYIWDRIALDFQNNSNEMRTINLDTLTSTSKNLSVTMPDNDFQPYYFWENRILTPRWILDFDWNVITSFSYRSVVPWDTWVLWANDNSFNIYKWIVDWDNVSFSKIGTWWTDQGIWYIYYWHLWAYQINSNDMQWNWNSSYIIPWPGTIQDFTSWWADWSRVSNCVSWADGKMYRGASRRNWWWRIEKIWTYSEWYVWNSLSTNWYWYWYRFWKFLWNIVCWWMWDSNWTWGWYWSNSYFIDTSWNLSQVQSSAFWYDTNVLSNHWFIDEKWWIYPRTVWWWSWVILKTDKTFTDLNWKNPYLRR